MDSTVVISGFMAVVVVVLIILIFNVQFEYWLNATKASVVSILTGKNPSNYIMDEDDFDSVERLNNPKVAVATNTPSVTNSTLDAMGYGSDAPWDEVMKATELDPSTYVNQLEYVKDVRRFSSGANFTAVNDDDQSVVFTNFVGLRRPQAIPGMIGGDARQVPDIDESVLTRNRGLIF